MIDKYGRAVQNIDINNSRNTADFVKMQGSFR